MALKDNIANLKYFWASLPLKTKILSFSALFVFISLVLLYSALYSGWSLATNDDDLSLGNSSVAVQPTGVSRQALDDGATVAQIEGRRIVEGQEVNQAARSGESYMPNFDLRSENIVEPEPGQVEADVNDRPTSSTISYSQMLSQNSNRNAEVERNDTPETALVRPAQNPRTTTDIITNRSSTSNSNIPISDEAVQAYIQQRATRLANAYSRSMDKQRAPSIQASGSFALSEEFFPEDPIDDVVVDTLESGNQNFARNEDGSAQCQLCPGDLITARITKDVDSRYSTNVELEIVDGALAGSPVFGKFQIVNQDAILKRDVRMVLVTDNWLYESGDGRFPGQMNGLVVDVRTGSQLIEQKVRTRSAVKWLAWASTSLLNTWSTRKIANATVIETTDTTQRQSSNLSESDVWAVSGGLLLGQLSDVAARWLAELPQITIDKNEIVSVMIVNPISETWLPELRKNEDYY